MPAEAKQDEDKQESRKTILVVDDTQFMHRLLRSAYTKAGYEVAQCTNGKEALRLADELLPRLIVMDVMMPEMDGLTAVKHLRNNPRTKRIPIIVLSSRGQTVTRVQAEEAGADLFLTKPFSPTELVQRTRTLLGREREAD